MKISRPVALIAIDVRPGWAEIWIDKKRRGHTPMQLQIEPGRHTIELKNPQRNFHAVYRVRAKTGTKVKITDKIEVEAAASAQPS